ncbi:SCO7613 C-terminal domain-containing membrane protein [Streptomyces sp. NPDC058847]|uniref:SCO7613 C-terminal domain-containing membrane protein n=1 Tax=Streptomyces sp. NPDC058847 TaxID=3346649 RepID=UPI003685AF94
MTNIPPPAEELRFLDAELRQLDARRALLLRRRQWLVHTLRTASAPQPARSAGPARPVWPAGAAGTAARRPEATAPGVQNVLLLLGGVLLTTAAIAFTLVGWGHLGITGRALVLGAVTLSALAAPVPLLRRGLDSTAEAVAALGMALTVLDAYALHEVAFTGSGGPGYTAAASAVLAGAWAAYGAGVGLLVPQSAGDVGAEQGPARAATRLALRLPLPFAAVTAQLPLLLWALAVDAGPHALTAVLLVTATADTAVSLRSAHAPVRVVTLVGACGTGAVGVLSAGWLCWSAPGPGAAARGAALLVLAAAIGLAAAWFAPKPDVAACAAFSAGLCLVAGAGGVLRASVPGEWTVPGCLVFGTGLLMAVRMPLPRPLRRGMAGASLVVQGLAVLWALPLVAGTVFGSVAWIERPWSGVPLDSRDAVFADAGWPSYAAAAPLVLAVVAVVLAVCERRAVWRPAAGAGALVLGWAAAVVTPVVLELPYGSGLVVQGVVVLASLGVAERARRVAGGPSARAVTAVVLALVTSVALALLSLATESGTIGVLLTLTALFGVASTRAGLVVFAAPAALGYAAALACAVGASAGRPPEHTALLVLVVPVVAALVAARTRGSAATVAVEGAGAAAALLSLALTVRDLPMLALVLSLCGVVTAGTALRPMRRRAGHAAAALFLLAAWVRLAAWDVTTPEAYTLPVTVAALAVGHLTRRRDPAVSSWVAYAAGPAVTLVPSLLAMWGDPHWLRPLLLGTAALAMALAGARFRLQAPLVLGGCALALVALHELAPYVAQAVGALPRWAPPALAGLALLALGATYEQRLRDARRLREALGRLR